MRTKKYFKVQVRIGKKWWGWADYATKKPALKLARELKRAKNPTRVITGHRIIKKKRTRKRKR